MGQVKSHWPFALQISVPSAGGAGQGLHDGERKQPVSTVLPAHIALQMCSSASHMRPLELDDATLVVLEALVEPVVAPLVVAPDVEAPDVDALDVVVMPEPDVLAIVAPPPAPDVSSTKPPRAHPATTIAETKAAATRDFMRALSPESARDQTFFSPML